jgi:hypothetical protein
MKSQTLAPPRPANLLPKKLFPKKKTRADLIVESVKGGEQA